MLSQENEIQVVRSIFLIQKGTDRSIEIPPGEYTLKRGAHPDGSDSFADSDDISWYELNYQGKLVGSCGSNIQHLIQQGKITFG